MRQVIAFLIALALATTAPAFAQSQPPTGSTGIGGDILQRGRVSIESGDLEQALVDFSLYLLFNPTDSRAYFLRGITYFSLNQPERAIADMTLAIDYSADQPEVHAAALGSRAEFYARSGRTQAAIGDLDALIAVQPSPDAYIQRAVIHIGRSSFDNAVSDLSEAIALTGGGQPELYFYRAFAHDALEHQAEAASDYLEWINSIGAQTSDADPLESGAALTLQMSESRVYRIPFSVRRGDEIHILARNVGGDVDPLVVILSPDGEPLIASDDVRVGRDTNALVSGYKAPVGGNYQLLVTHSLTGYNGRVQVLYEAR